MDVTKAAPPLDSPANVATKSGPTPQQSAASPSPENIVPLADRVDIQPLDLAAALQILIAEVRADLQLPADGSMVLGLTMPGWTMSGSMMQSPTQASQVLIQMFLQAVPADASDPPVWAAALTRVEIAFQTAVDRAVDAVAAWRNVPQFVVDAAKEARALVVSQLSDEPVSPNWLRPEWLGLAPKLERFWRRRRLARRGLTDPDFRPFQETERREPDQRETDPRDADDREPQP